MSNNKLNELKVSVTYEKVGKNYKAIWQIIRLEPYEVVHTNLPSRRAAYAALVSISEGED